MQTSENRGLIIENIVAIELWRRGAEIYYWKDYQNREVDFVIKEGTKVIQLIQVCENVSNINTKEREIKGLLESSKDLRCNNLLIITSDYVDEELIDNKKIKYIPLWRWLLET